MNITQKGAFLGVYWLPPQPITHTPDVLSSFVFGKRLILIRFVVDPEPILGSTGWDYTRHRCGSSETVTKNKALTEDQWKNTLIPAHLIEGVDVINLLLLFLLLLLL